MQKLSEKSDLYDSMDVKGVLFNTYSSGLDSFDEFYQSPNISYSRRNMIISIVATILIILIIVVVADLKSQINLFSTGLKQTYAELDDRTFDQNEVFDMVTSSISNVRNINLSFYDGIISILYPKSLVTTSLNENIADSIYKFILLPGFQKSSNEEAVLMYIFLINSNYSDSLEKYISKNINEFSFALNIPPEILNEYLKYNKVDRKLNFTGDRVWHYENNAINSSLAFDYIMAQYNKLETDSKITSSDVENFIKIYEKYVDINVLNINLMKIYYPSIKYKIPDDIRTYLDNYSNSKYIKEYNKNALFPKLEKIQVSSSELTRYSDVNIDSFNALLKLINSCLDTYNSTEKINLNIGNNGSVLKKTWAEIILTAQINSILNNFYSTSNSDVLFSDQDTSIFSPIEINYGDSGNFILSGNYVIPGIYTKMAVEVFMKTIINDYKSILTNLKVLGISTTEFTSIYQKAIDNYIGNYIQNYMLFINSLNYNVRSPVDLVYFLQLISASNSPLTQLVSEVKENTTFSKEYEEIMSPVIDKFSAFQKLDGKTKNNLALSSLKEYDQILSQISSSIDNTSDSGNTKYGLSTLGEIAMNISVNNDNSYLKLTNTWLDSINMPKELRKPFLEPILQVYKFGSKNLKIRLDNIWVNNMQYYVDKYKKMFPFDKNATSSIDPTEFSTVFSPTGIFWQNFNNYFAPFMDFNNGVWSLKDSIATNLIISNSMIDTINNVQKITSILWDKQSNPIPIEVYVAPQPLSEKKDNSSSPIIDMIVLNAGESKVIGVNAAPSFETLKIQWWMPSISTVSAQLVDGSSYNTPENQQVLSFFHLLKDAKINGNIYTWQIKTLNPEVGDLEAGFSFKYDPWTIFKL